MLKILIIENEEYKGVISSAIKNEGYDVDEVNDYDSFLEAIKAHKYNVIIFDVDVAARDDFFSVLKEYLGNVSLVVTCDKKDIEDKLIPVHENVNDIVLKPYNIESVIRNIGFIKERCRSQEYRQTLSTYTNSHASFHIPSEKIFIEYLSSYIDNFLNTNAFDDSSSFRIAFEEAISNAIIHGNNLDRSKFVTVDITLNKDEIVVVIENEGNGFNYYTAMLKFTDSQENIFRTGGRGLFLISLYTDDYYFENDGKRIVLKKNRTSSQN